MNIKNFNGIFILLVIFIIVLRLYIVFSNNKSNSYEKYSNKTTEIKAYINDEPQIKDFSQSFTIETIEINKEPIKIGIKIQTDRYKKYEYGDSILLNGKINKPRNFKSNGDRVFDYVDYLLKDDIYFEIKKPEIIVLNKDSGNIITKELLKIKQRFLFNLKRVLGEPHSALAGGLVVGEKAALGKDLIDDFRKAGLIHIVVLSGYNITIVADSIRRILSFLPRNIGIFLGILGIIAFGILVGGGATVIRSCIMAIIAQIAVLFRKDYSVSRALFLAGSIMLIQNPFILFFDPSFQLSFLATIALIVLSTPIENKLFFITEKFGIRGLVASTLATQIFVSPYILYMMGQLSIIGIIVNILVLPIIPITMLLVFFTGFFGFFSLILSKIFGILSHLLLSYELSMVHFFANIPFAYINLPKFSFWIVIAFYASYFVAFTKFSSTLSQFIFRKKSST